MNTFYPVTGIAIFVYMNIYWYDNDFVLKLKYYCTIFVFVINSNHELVRWFSGFFSLHGSLALRYSYPTSGKSTWVNRHVPPRKKTLGRLGSDLTCLFNTKGIYYKSKWLKNQRMFENTWIWHSPARLVKCFLHREIWKQNK